MNIEKKNDNIYTKELDSIDKYLVNIIKRFFQNDVETINNSAEAIILEAVTRAKKEIRLDGRYGVSSVNGKTGGVTLTAADLGAEPMIITKYSAFNKPFGNAADTVCEGNDPRLSDKRDPKPHNHKAADIITDPTNEFVTDAQIIKWDNKADKTLATLTNDGLMSKEYVKKLLDLEDDIAALPPETGDGYNHIPSGGAINNILGWAASGEAKWIDGTALFLAKDGTAADSSKLGGKDPSFYLDYNNFANVPSIPTVTTPVGNDGEVYYIKGASSNVVDTDYILKKAAIVENDTELNNLKTKLVDFSDIYSSWYRFSHDGTAQPAVVYSPDPSITLENAWILEGSQVKCVPNSTAYIGFISKEKFSDYTLEVTVGSADTDNDRIGVVIAFAKDDLGVEHTISALRNMENSAKWMLVYDYMKPNQKTISLKSTFPGESSYSGWSYCSGSRIRVVRAGDKIDVYCSIFNSTTILDTTKMSIDLSTDANYSIFRGPAAYGFSCQSQRLSTFFDIEFSGAVDTIYDITKDETWVKSGTTWSIDSTRDATIDMGVGRFVFNEYTSKLFHVSKDGIILVSMNPDEYVKKSEINKMIDDELRAKGLIS